MATATHLRQHPQPPHRPKLLLPLPLTARLTAMHPHHSPRFQVSFRASSRKPRSSSPTSSKQPLTSQKILHPHRDRSKFLERLPHRNRPSRALPPRRLRLYTSWRNRYRHRHRYRQQPQLHQCTILLSKRNISPSSPRIHRRSIQFHLWPTNCNLPHRHTSSLRPRPCHIPLRPSDKSYRTSWLWSSSRRVRYHEQRQGAESRREAAYRRVCYRWWGLWLFPYEQLSRT